MTLKLTLIFDMIKIIFILFVGIHGLIHLMGFLKAFGFAEIKDITKPISKSLGIIWISTGLIIVLSLIQFLMKNDYWWLIAIIGIVFSQILVILFWQDAKFGTIPNIFILVVSLIAYAQFNFNQNVSQEVDNLFSKCTAKEQSILSKEMITDLPLPVQNWLTNSGVIGCTLNS